MKICIDGVLVCSICGAVWETYHGLNGDEPAQCASCGASPEDDGTTYDPVQAEFFESDEAAP